MDKKAIYNKYNGHCAYCGREIAYKDMQVDHIRPKHQGGYWDENIWKDVNDENNLMPSPLMQSLQTRKRIRILPRLYEVIARKNRARLHIPYRNPLRNNQPETVQRKILLRTI